VHHVLAIFFFTDNHPQDPIRKLAPFLHRVFSLDLITRPASVFFPCTSSDIPDGNVIGSSNCFVGIIQT
jgi:hypothetical protein